MGKEFDLCSIECKCCGRKKDIRKFRETGVFKMTILMDKKKHDQHVMHANVDIKRLNVIADEHPQLNILNLREDRDEFTRLKTAVQLEKTAHMYVEKYLHNWQIRSALKRCDIRSKRPDMEHLFPRERIFVSAELEHAEKWIFDFVGRLAHS